MMRRRVLLLLALFIGFANSAVAQGPRRTTHFDRPPGPLPSLQQQHAPVGNMILGGLVGGAVGFFAGGYAGALLNDSEDGNPDDLDALEGFVVGAIIGETFTLPLGVHLANKRRGNFGLSLLASSVATAAGLLIATAGEDEPLAVVPIPIIQLGSSVILEQKTTK